MTFDQWIKKRNQKYVASDDTIVLRNLRECWRDALGEAVKVCETFGDEYMCQSTTSEIVKEIRELK